jgi:two-component system phosphate regulon response regulator OmpR
LRRSQASTAEGGEEGPTLIEFGPFLLNLRSHSLSRGEDEIPLTSGEFELLKIFTQHPNCVLSRDRLLTLTKGYEHAPFDRSIDVRVNRLRRKIEDDPSSPLYIRTVWGSGYCFYPDG